MITQKDIARKVGVSETTVSLVLGGKQSTARIAGKTISRIMKAAETMGYCRNELASSTATGKSNIIAVIGNLSFQEYDAKMFNGVMNEALSRGYYAMPLDINYGNNVAEVISRSIGQRVRGIICRSLPEDCLQKIYQRFAPLRVPIAIMSSSFPHQWGIRVYTDDIDGMKQTVEHLADLGHTRIAHLAAGLEFGYASIRRKGFLEAMIDNGMMIDKHLLVESDWREFESHAYKLLKRKDRPTAIVCVNDQSALEVVRAASRLGLKIPQDLSVTGYGNISYTRWTFPTLTSVEHNCESIGNRAMHLLSEAIDNKDIDIFSNQIEEKIPVKLVVRESTGPAPESIK